MTTATVDTLEQLALLAQHGAKFALPKGRSKKYFDDDWTEQPHTLEEAIEHAKSRQNVGLLTGAHSGGLVALDRDISWAATLALFGEEANTWRIVRDNAPERGKLLFRCTGELPPSRAWKPKGEKHPHAEMLSNGRHALIPPSMYEHGCYLLVNLGAGIRDMTLGTLNGLWFLITGEFLTPQEAHESERDAQQERRDYIARVKAAWTPEAVFRHFGKVSNGTQEERGEVRLLGNAGLLLKDALWYCHGDTVGGDNLDAWHYCLHGSRMPRNDKRAFWDIVDDMAKAAGIAKPSVNGVAAGNGDGAKRNETDAPEVGSLYKPMSEHIEADLRKWGYTFAVNDLEDMVLVNGEPLTDFVDAQLRTLARDKGYGSKGKPSLGALEDMVRVLANRNRFHPVRDYLNGLTWDGKNHFGLVCMHFRDAHEPISYNNGLRLNVFDAWLRRWALGAVAKAFGEVRACQQNAMLVLDGAQGKGKSYFARWLCSPLPDMFEEGSISPNDKEHTRKQTTKWLWEVSELGSTVRAADREALKAFITHATLTYRRPYDRNNIVKPALASFLGTMNNESGFLTDPTGNRRFLVCTLTDIDWKYAQKADPNQFWAQIVHWYKDGQTWELTPEEVARRDANNEDYEAPDVYQDAMLRHFEFTGEDGDFLTTVEIVQHLQDCGIRDNPRAVSMAISAALRRLGHTPVRGWSDAGRVRGYKGIKPISLSLAFGTGQPGQP